MKRRAFLTSAVGMGLMAAIPAKAASVLIFNLADGNAIDYRTSVNTPSFIGRADVVIDPVLPFGVPLRYIIVQGGVVREMTPAEKSAKDTAEANAALIAQRISAAGLLNGDAALNRAVRALLEVIAQSTGRTRQQVRSAFGNAIESDV